MSDPPNDGSGNKVAAAKRHERRAEAKRRRKQDNGSALHIARARCRDILKLMRGRCGPAPFPDTRDVRHLLHAYLVHATKTEVRPDAVLKANTPFLDEDERRELIQRASREHLWSSEALANYALLTADEREEFGITAIRPLELADDAAFEKRTTQRRSEQRRHNRRAKGVIPRGVWLSNSNAAEKPWEREGISRSSYYRKRKSAEQLAPADQSTNAAKSEGGSGPRNEPASPPQVSPGPTDVPHRSVQSDVFGPEDQLEGVWKGASAPTGKVVEDWLKSNNITAGRIAATIGVSVRKLKDALTGESYLDDGSAARLKYLMEHTNPGGQLRKRRRRRAKADRHDLLV